MIIKLSKKYDRSLQEMSGQEFIDEYVFLAILVSPVFFATHQTPGENMILAELVSDQDRWQCKNFVALTFLEEAKQGQCPQWNIETYHLLYLLLKNGVFSQLDSGGKNELTIIRVKQVEKSSSCFYRALQKNNDYFTRMGDQ